MQKRGSREIGPLHLKYQQLRHTKSYICLIIFAVVLFLLCETQGSWEHASCCVLHIRGPQWLAKPRGIKDDNLLGIPPHFLIETRGVMDSRVERSTGPVCWGPSVGSCSVYAPPQEWKASVSRAILFSERRSASCWWRRCRGELRWCSPHHPLFITRSSDKTCRQNLNKWQERTGTRERALGLEIQRFRLWCSRFTDSLRSWKLERLLFSNPCQNRGIYSQRNDATHL